MSSPYPDEALGYPVGSLADVIRHDLDDALISNEASATHGLYALALALAWRLQSFPMAEQAVLCEGVTGLIRANALEVGDGS
jgi:hypothetical protein